MQILSFLSTFLVLFLIALTSSNYRTAGYHWKGIYHLRGNIWMPQELNFGEQAPLADALSITIVATRYRVLFLQFWSTYLHLVQNKRLLYDSLRNVLNRLKVDGEQTREAFALFPTLDRYWAIQSNFTTLRWPTWKCSLFLFLWVHKITSWLSIGFFSLAMWLHQTWTYLVSSHVGEPPLV